MLKLDNIYHRYNKSVTLNYVNLDLEPGKVLSLTGPSGSGKTSILRIVAGLISDFSGSLKNDFNQSAYIFQEPRLLPWRTALDNIAYGLKSRAVTVNQRRQIALELATRLELSEVVNKYPHQLSGGMRQRVALGRALAIEPDLLLMDEPFSALDIGLRRELQDLVLTLIEERNMAVIFVTHDLTEAVRMGDEVLMLSAAPGRVMYRWQQDRLANKRDEKYIQQSVASLLSKPQVIVCFGNQARG